ncbi:hypothetical protein CYMTET_13490 [Cymbomonas tetramitiformis]|uniref:Uncharacterized protein n=1 Tax=Cymbomonas tetramitiformis TaxID=36881 RepID=A0AAE0LBD9_9CHLO|nr:hypothetical protein CYMTET_13490 [Cymbomonas tetramitiformis]
MSALSGGIHALFKKPSGSTESQVELKVMGDIVEMYTAASDTLLGTARIHRLDEIHGKALKKCVGVICYEPTALAANFVIPKGVWADNPDTSHETGSKMNALAGSIFAVPRSFLKKVIVSEPQGVPGTAEEAVVAKEDTTEIPEAEGMELEDHETPTPAVPPIAPTASQQSTSTGPTPTSTTPKPTTDSGEYPVSKVVYREPSKEERSTLKKIKGMLEPVPSICQVVGTGWQTDEAGAEYYTGTDPRFVCTVCREAGGICAYAQGTAGRIQSQAGVGHVNSVAHKRCVAVLEEKARKKRKVVEVAKGAFLNWAGTGRFTTPIWKMANLFMMCVILAYENVAFAFYEAWIQAELCMGSASEHTGEIPIPQAHYDDRRLVPKFLKYVANCLILDQLSLLRRVNYFTMLIDECTSRSIVSCAAIYICFQHPDTFESSVIFFGLFKLHGDLEDEMLVGSSSSDEDEDPLGLETVIVDGDEYASDDSE